eukprot:TRINITY_DN65601_c0_g1_i1.p1 TRINITY_DN65601_c0_g1~~TRINITY_DN65601_c0_g1_i1.p1  ORF type:complete len:391 (+),score=36.64 TRINITY_DN65601_c0_g1_i1:325-1497(+)
MGILTWNAWHRTSRSRSFPWPVVFQARQDSMEVSAWSPAQSRSVCMRVRDSQLDGTHVITNHGSYVFTAAPRRSRPALSAPATMLRVASRPTSKLHHHVWSVSSTKRKHSTDAAKTTRPAPAPSAAAAAPPSLHAMGLKRLPARTGGRGMFASVLFADGEQVFKEEACLDSIASANLISSVFGERPAQHPSQCEAIWSLVANYVMLMKSSDLSTLQRIAAIDSFYQAEGHALGEDPYRDLAGAMHAAMLPEAQAVAPLEKIVRLLFTARLNSHTVLIFPDRQEPPEDDGAAPGVRVSPRIQEGLALFPLLHLTNHSCSANTAFTALARSGFRGNSTEMTLMATQTISVGDEITISYLDDRSLSLPTAGRRRLLAQDFGFFCECDRCQSDA